MKMNNKFSKYTLVYFGILILLLNFVNADIQVQSLKPVQLGQTAFLTQNCVNSTYSNISRVSYPNSSFALNGEFVMTKKGNDYNYTFTDTNNLGDYLVYGHCNENGVDTSWVYSFPVTPNGKIQTSAQGLNSFAYIFLMVVLTGLFGWIGFKLSESKSLWVVGIFFLFLAILLMTYDVWLGVEYSNNLTGQTSGMATIIFYIFLGLVVLGTLVSLALLFTRWKELYRYYKNESKSKQDDEELDLGDKWN